MKLNLFPTLLDKEIMETEKQGPDDMTEVADVSGTTDMVVGVTDNEASTDSGTTNMVVGVTDNEANTDNSLQDTLVAVVGKGATTWTLADQRIDVGGRLLVLLTDRKPAGRYVKGDFQWDPPKRVELVGEQAREMALKYKVGPCRRWVRKGPDIVELKDDEVYEIEDQGRGLRVLSQNQVVWEVSARTLIAADVDFSVPAEQLQALTSITVGYFSTTALPTVSGTFACMAILLLLFSIGFCFNDYEKEDMLPYFRMWNVSLLGGIWGTACGPTAWGFGFVGIFDSSTISMAQGFLISCVGYAAITIVPIGSSTLTSFVVTLINVNVVSLNVLVPLHLYKVAQPGWKLLPGERAPETINVLGCVFAWPRYWKWGLASINLGFGGWIMFYAMGVVYVMMVGAGYSNVAQVMLPVMVTGYETVEVWMLQLAFAKFLFPLRPSGDMVFNISSNLATAHMFAESVKLVGMVSAAAVCEDNPNGLTWPSEGSCNPYGWMLSVVTGLVITIAGRLGWTRYLMGRFFRIVGLRKVAILMAPSVVTKMHDEMKYYMGYARFVIPASVVIANLVTGKEPFLFNIPATICLLTSVAMELIEDTVVGREVLPYPPSPRPDIYTQYDNYDPNQMYTFGSSPEEERSSRRASGRRSHAAPTLLGADGDYFGRALALHGTREWMFKRTIGYVGLGVFYSMPLYQLLLGAGYFHGVCPLPLTEEDRFKEAFLWPMPLNACRYSS